MVSTGLAALGYEYINLGMILISVSLLLLFFEMISSLVFLDDCWAELDRDSQVTQWLFSSSHFIILCDLYN